LAVSSQQRNFRIFLLAVGVFCLLSGIFVPWLGRKWLRADHDDAPIQETTGEIVLLTAERIDNGVHYEPKVLVRFEKGMKRVSQITDMEAKQFMEKQKVRVFYRVGKTGSVYVDRIAPLKQEAKP
jgi:hypothetical protein